MKYWKTYLERYAFPHQQISDPPPDDLDLVVVIPAFLETSIINTLTSLFDCNPTKKITEVIVVFNEPVDITKQDSEINEKCFREALSWKENHEESFIHFHIIYLKNIPQKKHGVGFARKIGMDEALKRFHTIHNMQGVIACFDADSTCTPNYLSSIENHFQTYPDCPGTSIYFEHAFEHLDDKRKNGIIQYELHLRYFIHAQRYAGFVAFQTIGSSMAVRADAYAKQGGMNTRKAGEDFYFLSRIIQLGGFMEIRSATVFPSSRISDRVPFGTGRAMLSWEKEEQSDLFTYNPKSFVELAKLNPLVNHATPWDLIYADLPEAIGSFFKSNFKEKYEMLRKTTNRDSFIKRFNSTFDGFVVMKYLHYARDNFFKDIPVKKAASWLLQQSDNQQKSETPENLLREFRSLDRAKEGL